MSTTQKDRINTAFMSMRKNILSGDDRRAFETLKAIIKTETKNKKVKS